MSEKLEVGCCVTFTDQRYVDHDALVTAIHGDPGQKPCVNLVFVRGEEDRQDCYGRQTEHESSVVHATNNSAGGYCWRCWGG